MVSRDLVLSGVEAGYDGRAILRDINLHVRPGEVLAIVGPNGVGKSTLIKTAAGTLKPRKGAVRIGGEDLADLRAAERARRVSVVGQALNLPPAFSALDVVMMGRTPYLGWFEREGERDREIALQAMERTETAALAQRPISELSGGERQRVLIARALAQNAPIMLMDEPTAHLDLRHQDAQLKLVRRLVEEDGLAVLIALHDLNLVARFADRVALLSTGTIHVEGLPEQVLTPDHLAAVYGIEIHVMKHPIHGKPLVLTGE
ncbi:MAG: ABC transporter ATP-binding protein [Anaerolineales bacterium]